MSRRSSCLSTDQAATLEKSAQPGVDHARGDGSREPDTTERSVAGDEPSRLDQNLSFIGLCGIAVTTGESWVVLGNSLSLSIYNGGPPGVLFGFVVDSICYWVVALSIAELASSMPSTATVHKWASVAGGRYGRACSWYAGWWNLAAWIVGAASLTSFLCLQVLGAWETTHPGFTVANWHVFCSYITANVLVLLLTLYGGKWLARLQSTGVFFTLAGWFISVVVSAVLPAVQGNGYESSTAVWTEWEDETGWSSQGFVFCLGMLNAAFAVCAPDISSHMAEEIPNPQRNIPLCILAQYVLSFITGFCYLITIFYSATDIEAIAGSDSIFPLAQIYKQATGSSATIGLLTVAMIPTVIGATGAFGIAGRQAWALAREGVVPFGGVLGHLRERDQTPFNATLLTGAFTAALGCLYLGSTQAFNAFAGSFVVFTSLSYLAALVPHLLSGRRNVQPGVFWIPGTLGLVVCALSCAYLSVFAVIFCFPPYLPVTAANMNYTSPIVCGWTLLVTLYWFLSRTAKRPA